MAKEKLAMNHYFSSNPKSKIKLGKIDTHLRGKAFTFLTASGVFSKKRIDLGTRILIESMIIPENGRILDLGCGYGAVGIAIASFNPNLEVFMVDVNKRATWLTKQNLAINHVSNVTVKRGRLCDPVNNLLFDGIFTNPPISAGLLTINQLVKDAAKHMSKQASLQVVIKSKIRASIRKILEENFATITVLVKKSGYRVLLAKNRLVT